MRPYIHPAGIANATLKFRCSPDMDVWFMSYLVRVIFRFPTANYVHNFFATVNYIFAVSL